MVLEAQDLSLFRSVVLGSIVCVLAGSGYTFREGVGGDGGRGKRVGSIDYKSTNRVSIAEEIRQGTRSLRHSCHTKGPTRAQNK